MRVRLILLAGAVLLGASAIYAWKSGNPSTDLVEFGQAATNQRSSDTGAGVDKNFPQAAALGRPSLPDDNPKDSAAPRVTVTPVRKGEVPIYLSGIGTVQAYYTVNISSQVDGVILTNAVPGRAGCQDRRYPRRYRPNDLSGQA